MESTKMEMNRQLIDIETRFEIAQLHLNTELKAIALTQKLAAFHMEVFGFTSNPFNQHSEALEFNTYASMAETLHHNNTKKITIIQ